MESVADFPSKDKIRVCFIVAIVVFACFCICVKVTDKPNGGQQITVLSLKVSGVPVVVS